MTIARIFFETIGILIGYAIGGSAIMAAFAAERWIWKLMVGAVGGLFLIRAGSELLFHSIWPTKVIAGVLIIPSTIAQIVLVLGFLSMKTRRYGESKETEESDTA